MFLKLQYLTFLSTALIVMSCGNSSKLTPIAYNDSLVTQQIKVVEAAEKLQEVLDTYVKQDMETIYGRLRGQINLSKAKTEGFGDFNDNKNFKDATLEFISAYQQLTENEYKEALSLLSKSDSLYSKTDEARVELLYKEIDKKTAQATEKYRLAQNEFAKENRINFTEPKK
jgi:hypothetical protein